MEKDPDAYRTISEVGETLDIPPHVLRFWETKFPQVKPLKRGGGRRYYRRGDVVLLQAIRRLLYEDAYTIRGVQRLLKSKGIGGVLAMTPDAAPPPADDRPGTTAQPQDLSGIAVVDDVDARALLERLVRDIAECRAILDTSLRQPAEAAAN